MADRANIILIIDKVAIGNEDYYIGLNLRSRWGGTSFAKTALNLLEEAFEPEALKKFTTQTFIESLDDYGALYKEPLIFEDINEILRTPRNSDNHLLFIDFVNKEIILSQ